MTPYPLNPALPGGHSFKEFWTPRAVALGVDTTQACKRSSAVANLETDRDRMVDSDECIEIEWILSVMQTCRPMWRIAQIVRHSMSASTDYCAPWAKPWDHPVIAEMTV